MPNPLNPGAMATNPQNQETFADLLNRGRQQLATQLIDTPTPLDRLADFGNLYAMSQAKGAEGFNLAKQQQVENQRAQQEQLRGLLAQEDERSLAIAKQSFDQLKAQGDKLAAQVEILWPDEFQRSRAALRLMQYEDAIVQANGLSSPDEIPYETEMQLLGIIAQEIPSTATSPTTSIVVSGTDPLNAKLGLGIPADERARVEVQRDEKGNIVSGSVAGRFGAGMNVTVEGDKVQLRQDINLADLQTKIHEETQKTYGEALKTDRTLGLLKASLDSGAFETGFGGETRQFFSQMVEFFGGDPSNFPGLGDPATAENIQAAADRLAIDYAGELSRLTNMSINLVRSAGPSLMRTVRGNKLIVELAIEKNERDKARANFADEYVGNYGYIGGPEKNLQLALKKWDRDNPAWTEEDTQRVNKIARSKGVSIKEALGDLKVTLPKYYGQVDRMEDREVISFFRNVDDETWVKFQELYPEVAEYMQERYISLTE